MLLKRLKTCFSKVHDSCGSVVGQFVKSGQHIMIGGFGICGIPHSLISAIEKNKSIQNLTLIANDPGLERIGPGALISSGQTEKLITSYITNHVTE